MENLMENLESYQIAEASDYAQDCVQDYLANQGNDVEISVYDGEVYADADQELINILQNMFDEKFNEYAKSLQN